MRKIEIQKINLIPLINTGMKSQIKLLAIRNEESIKKWMYSDHEIQLDEHLDWINQLKNTSNQLVFVIFDENEKPLGSVSLNQIDKLNKRTDWAFYLTKNSRGGLGSAIEYEFIKFVFNNMDILKLNCEVIEGNNSVIKLHKKFLFKDEGFRNSNIIKGEHRLGVHLLGLTKVDWISGEKIIFEKYKKVLQKFNISISLTDI
jgi:UDP-4-amino-4,6-dideoxy-N-acetyl-beta-L-altrosamine N-acetyltransferase